MMKDHHHKQQNGNVPTRSAPTLRLSNPREELSSIQEAKSNRPCQRISTRRPMRMRSTPLKLKDYFIRVVIVAKPITTSEALSHFG